MSAHLQRAGLLLEQARFDMAESEARRALGAEPNSSQAYALLALSQAGQEKLSEATQSAQQAIALAPDEPFCHYVLAEVYNDRHRLDEAQRAIIEAIRLDPYDADYFATLARIHVQRQKWRDALDAAEQGLKIDAQHVVCANMRALSLTKLGRRAEAAQTMAAALARQPDNALTHANQGWALLEQGDPKKALEHFREALRLEPEMEWARAGIVEAMKARNIVYAAMLKYFLFMSRFPPRTQWMIILGAVFGIRILNGLAKQHPPLAPFVLPISLAYLAFVLMTWIAQPLFNLLLRLNKFGRYALSRDQTMGANLFGLCILAAVGVMCLTPWIGPLHALVGAGMCCMLVLPTAGIFNCKPGWPRRLMVLYTVALAALGLWTYAVHLAQLSVYPDPRQAPIDWDAGLGIFLLGTILSSWVGAALGTVRARK